jgi:hypothetical protein
MVIKKITLTVQTTEEGMTIELLADHLKNLELAIKDGFTRGSGGGFEWAIDTEEVE